MQGQFDLIKYDARGLTEEDFLRANRTGRLEELLSNLQKTGEYKAVSNRLFDNLAGYWLDHVFQGPDVAYPYNISPGSASALGNITLLTTDSETTSYTEDWGGGATHHDPFETANSLSAGKRFVVDQLVPFVVQTTPNADGREEIQFTNKWLYLPGEGISTDIRSIGIFYAELGNADFFVNRGRIGRVRIKDQNGDRVIIHKSGEEVLIVQYSFRLLSN